MNTKHFNPETLELTFDYRHAAITHRFVRIVEEFNTLHQNVKIMWHEELGKVVLADHDVMGSEHDEAYNEAMLHLMFRSLTSENFNEGVNVLILGGGDLFLAARLATIPFVKQITVVEIDKMMPVIHEHHFPERTKNSFTSKVRIVNEDVMKYVPDMKYEFVFDDMFCQPIGGEVDYHVSLAETFKSSTIISQTGSKLSGEGNETFNKLSGSGLFPIQITPYIPTYLEVWTFTSYKKV